MKKLVLGFLALLFCHDLVARSLTDNGRAAYPLKYSALSASAGRGFNRTTSLDAGLGFIFAASVSSVSVPANSTYTAGQTLNFTVNFNKLLTVNTAGGIPWFPITIGATVYQASYVSGSGTGALVFTYTVLSGEYDGDGITVGAAIALNGGLIQDSFNINALLGLNSIASTTGVLVGILPPMPPVIGAPANGSSTANNRAPITGTAEANSGVTLTVDGMMLATVTADAGGNFSYTPTTSEAYYAGSHTVSAVATNAGGPGAASTTNTFTVTLPAPVILTPAAGSSMSNTRPVITGTAQAGLDVQLYLDGALLTTVSADNSGNFSYTPTLAQALSLGIHSITAMAVSETASSPLSAATSFTTTVPAPAAPVISTPADGSSTANNRSPVTGTAEANSSVTITLDGMMLATVTADAGGNFSYTPTTSQAYYAGSHTVSAVATNAGGPGAASTTSTFTVTLPAPVILTPASGSSNTGKQPVITGTAQAGLDVQLYLDGTLLTTVSTDNSGNFSYTPTLAQALTLGSHTITAIAVSETASSPPSAADTFAILAVIIPPAPGPPSAPVITSPATGSSGPLARPLITGTADGNSTITVYDGTTVIATTTADSAGTWSLTPVTPLSTGHHNLTAASTTTGGTTRSAGTTGIEVVSSSTSIPSMTSVHPANLITPNGDGKNDTWVIKNIEFYPRSVVSIFDRAGRRLMQVINYQNDWNGSYQGQPLAEDTYYYVIDFGPGTVPLKGFITLLRNR